MSGNGSAYVAHAYRETLAEVALRHLRIRPYRLPLFLDRYNYKRPHGSLGHQPPAARLTNLARNYN